MTIARPVLLDVPERMETGRLELRAVRAGTGARANAGIRESHAEIGPWMPWANPCPSAEETEEWCRQAEGKFWAREEFHYQIFRKGTAELLGAVGIHDADWSVPAFEIGYWLRTAETGKGYMREAVGRVVEMALDVLSAERLVIRCDERNRRSSAVAERAGFVLEMVRRNDSRDARTGELTSTRVYARVRGGTGAGGAG